jgi:membrane fusion protein, multidrug efflux system
MNQIDKPEAPRTAGTRTSPKKNSAWKWLTALIFIGAAVAVYYFFPPKTAVSAAGPGGMGGGKGGGGGGRGGRFGANGPTPVSTAQAEKSELRVYISALGTAVALNTITVRSRADGELMKIHFTEGQSVKAGDLLAEIDPRQYEVSLEQSQGQLARDAALLDNSKRDLERYSNAGEAVTQQQLDAAKSTVAQYEGSVRTDQGAVDNYKLQLSYCRIIAPISGKVGLRLVDQGNLVHSSDQAGLLVIVQEEPISVVFSVPEKDLPQIRKAMKGDDGLPVDAYDAENVTKLASGKLVAIDNQIDITSGTVRMKSQFANQDHTLFPNQFVNVHMLTEVDPDVLMVPNSAVQLNGTARFVFVVNADDTVSRRTVTTGRTEGERTAVLDGLKEGETVVTEGVDRLQDGTKIQGKTVIPIVPETPGRGRKGGKRGGMGGKGGDKGGDSDKSGATPTKSP